MHDRRADLAPAVGIANGLLASALLYALAAAVWWGMRGVAW